MKLILNNVGNLTDTTTAAATINNNNDTLETAFENTLSRDGTAPNKMGSVLDMDSNQIINLPSPIGGTSPLRLQDLSSFNGGGIIATVPPGGLTGQSLQKNSNADYDLDWGNNVNSVGLSLPNDLTVTNSPVTTSGTLTANWAVTPTGTGAIVRATSPTLASPSLGTPTVLVGTNITGTASGLTAGNVTTNANLTGDVTSVGNATTLATVNSSPGSFGSATATPTVTVNGKGLITAISNTTVTPAIGSVTGLGTGVATFLTTPSSANLASAVTNETGSGALVFGTSPALTSPVLTTPVVSGVTFGAGQYPGEITTGSATAGNVGEYIEANLVVGSATPLTTNTAKTVTSIVLTAGDWDVCGSVYFQPNAATTITLTSMGISLTNNTQDLTAGRWAQKYPAVNTTGQALTDTVNPVRISVSGSTTVYLVAYCTFLTNTCSAWGTIRARRAR